MTEPHQLRETKRETVSLGRTAAMQQVVESGSFSPEEMLKAYSDSRNPADTFLQSDALLAPDQENTK